jgi:uncharacterized protein (TIGR00290 family)
LTVTPRPKAFVSWSSGKDSAWALHAVRQAGEVEIAGLLTTTNDAVGRVAMHGVRETLLDAQAARAGLPLMKVPLPWPCPNDAYEALMAEAVARLVADGVTHMIFGDLFLEDIRAYRDRNLAGAGIAPVYPLWQRDTRELAREMIAGGLVATVVSVDPAQLDPGFAGRTFDARFLGDLPDGADPCGENGEFHTLVTDGPMFDRPIPTAVGETVTRDGFVFTDMRPA